MNSPLFLQFSLLLSLFITLAQCVDPRKPSIPASPLISSRGPTNSNERPGAIQGGVIVKHESRACTCVPVNECNYYDILSGPPSNNGNGNYNGNYQNNGNYNGNNYNNNQGSPLPNYNGQAGVAHGIDPRYKPETSSSDETNSTVIDAPSRNARAVPESAEPPIDNSRFPVGSSNGNGNKKDDPRIVTNGSPSCRDRQVCCRSPTGTHPVDRESYPSGTINKYPKPGYPNQNKNGDPICGKRNHYGVNGRILQGTKDSYSMGYGDTEFGEYPWQAAILKKENNDNNVFVCGGSFIDSRHVITAAHCVQNLRTSQIRVRLGDWDVGSDAEYYRHVDFEVTGVAIHPDFNSVTLYNDIAIVKLQGDVDLRQHPHISPICLPDKHSDFTGKRCIVTGWGKDAWGGQGKFQHRLNEVDVPIVNHYECERKLQNTKLGRDFRLHTSFICAGGEANRDACKGDGGGPLACFINNQWQLAGVVSWGVECGKADVPGVYMRTAFFNDWIAQNIRY